MKARAWFAAVLCLALGVSASARAEQPPAVTPQIYGGSLVDPGAFDTVVALVGSNGALCTGTLVAPRIVLTAAHCLSDLPEGELPDVYYGTLVLQGRKLAALRAGIHPSFCASCVEDVNDYGFVELADDLAVDGPYPRPIVEQDVWDTVMQEEHPVTLVGYGESDDAPASDPYRGAGQKRFVDTTITQLSDTGLELLAGGSGESTCQGDSGGPALAAYDGELRLVGVLSRGECGSESFYGAAYPSLCWLRDETQVNLLPSGCESCDCLDTEPGCGCRLVPTPPSSAAIGAWLVAAAALVARRKWALE